MIRDRRVPLRPGDWWAAGIAFIHMAQLYVSGHIAAPFGATSSVHGWERLGGALTHILRRFLKIALCRYVDDLFGPERYVVL